MALGWARGERKRSVCSGIKLNIHLCSRSGSKVKMIGICLSKTRDNIHRMMKMEMEMHWTICIRRICAYFMCLWTCTLSVHKPIIKYVHMARKRHRHQKVMFFLHLPVVMITCTENISFSQLFTLFLLLIFFNLQTYRCSTLHYITVHIKVIIVIITIIVSISVSNVCTCI